MKSISVVQDNLDNANKVCDVRNEKHLKPEEQSSNILFIKFLSTNT